MLVTDNFISALHSLGQGYCPSDVEAFLSSLPKEPKHYVAYPELHGRNYEVDIANARGLSNLQGLSEIDNVGVLLKVT